MQQLFAGIPVLASCVGFGERDLVAGLIKAFIFGEHVGIGGAVNGGNFAVALLIQVDGFLHQFQRSGKRRGLHPRLPPVLVRQQEACLQCQFVGLSVVLFDDGKCALRVVHGFVKPGGEGHQMRLGDKYPGVGRVLGTKACSQNALGVVR
ncbi:hypothetical protein D3C81_741980 [compost metagenome]